MTTRKEIRNELLKEDAVHSYMEKIARYIQAEPQKALGALIGFFVLLGGLSVYLAMSDSRKDAKAAELYKAEKILNTDLSDPKAELKFADVTEKNLAALKELDAVIGKSSGPEKALAISYKIDILTQLGRGNETEPLYQELAKSGSPQNFFGELGLAEIAMSKSDWDGAIAQLKKIRSGSGREMAMDELLDYKLAKCHEAKGDLQGAKAILQEMAAKYSGDEAEQPPILTKAKALLSEIDGKLGKAPSST